MSKTRNGIGFGYRTGVASKGSLLNLLPDAVFMSENDLFYFVTEDELYAFQSEAA